MNKYWSGLVVASAMAATVTLAGQSAQQNPANTPPPDAAAPAGAQRTPAPPSAQTRTPNTVTISGCIQSAPATTAAAPAARPEAPGATAPGAGERRFVLANASMTAGGESRAGGAVGTAGTTETRYQLEGDAAMISPHMNHRVEITGMLQSSAASPTGAERAAPGATAAAPILKVESVKMVADTCTPATPGTTGQETPGRETPGRETPGQPDPAPVQPPQP
jgi:hypothetical protein